MKTLSVLDMREALKGAINFTDNVNKEIYDRLDNNPELIEKLGRRYELLADGIPMRPTLGNEMQYLYSQERNLLTFMLFPELLDVAYNIGKIIGRHFVAPYLSGNTLYDVLKTNQPLAKLHNYAIEEIVECGQDFGIYRHYECGDCYGVPNIGMKICAYEAGTAAGGFEVMLGRPVQVTETHCIANGDPYCQFEVRVL